MLTLLFLQGVGHHQGKHAFTSITFIGRLNALDYTKFRG